MKLTRKITALCTVVLAMLIMLSISASAASKPAKPTGLKVVATAGNKVSLTWKKSAGADYYKIYVKKDGKWKWVKNPETNGCEVSGLYASKTYTFAVKSVNKSGKKTYESDGYASVSVKTKALTASKLTFMAGADYVRLSWKKVPGATGYYVYQLIGGEWKKVKTLSADTLAVYVKQLKTNSVHQFYVRAYTSGDGKKINGPKSNTVKPKTLKANKVKVKASASNTSSVTLTWSKAADASGYCIYRYVDGEWKIVKTVKSRDTLKNVVTALKSDSKYSFRVRAYKNSSSGKLWFVPSDTVVATTDPTSKDLTVKRTKNLSKILNGNSFTLSYKTETQTYGTVPVKIYKNGTKYRLDSRAEEINYVLLNLEKNDYVLLTGKKLYARLPSSLSRATDIKSAVNALLPEKDWNGKAVLTEFGGKKVVCEIFTDILKTKSVRYYYRAGELVGIEQYNSKGKVVERATVTALTKTASTSLFKVPGGYKEIF